MTCKTTNNDYSYCITMLYYYYSYYTLTVFSIITLNCQKRMVLCSIKLGNVLTLKEPIFMTFSLSSATRALSMSQLQFYITYLQPHCSKCNRSFINHYYHQLFRSLYPKGAVKTNCSCLMTVMGCWISRPIVNNFCISGSQGPFLSNQSSERTLLRLQIRIF